MSDGPAGYILRLTDERRRGRVLHDLEMKGVGSQSVDPFRHARRYPLVGFVSFEHGQINALAEAKLGQTSQSGERRLSITLVRRLRAPITTEAILGELSAAIRTGAARALEHGGYLGPATYIAVATAVAGLSEEAEQWLESFDPSWRLAELSAGRRTVLALQKEAIAGALTIAGIDRKVLRGWRAPRGPVRNYLSGVTQKRPYEDRVIRSDLYKLPGHEMLERLDGLEGAVFEQGDRRLTVLLADRNDIETQTGADLLYFNETFGSWVLVQYKMMDRRGTGRPSYSPDARTARQIARMEALLAALRDGEPNASCEGYRLSENPLYFKLCDRLLFDPRDEGLSRGMYLPLDYWRLLVTDDRTASRGATRVLRYDNVGRHLSNTEFVTLVSGGWIGTSIVQSDLLGAALHEVLTADEPQSLIVAIDNLRERIPASGRSWQEDQATDEEADEDIQIGLMIADEDM